LQQFGKAQSALERQLAAAFEAGGACSAVVVQRRTLPVPFPPQEASFLLRKAAASRRSPRCCAHGRHTGKIFAERDEVQTWHWGGQILLSTKLCIFLRSSALNPNAANERVVLRGWVGVTGWCEQKQHTEGRTKR
jgi:hypothetical protein